MGGLIQLFRSRVGVAIVGAILVGGVGAAFGVGSVWHPMTPITGGVVQAATTATTASAAAQATNTPEATATPAATATTIPTVGPTPTPFSVGARFTGTVIASPGATSFVISRNHIHYTIQVDAATTYTSGTATQLSGILTGWRATITVASFQGGVTYLAANVAASAPPPDN